MDKTKTWSVANELYAKCDAESNKLCLFHIKPTNPEPYFNESSNTIKPASPILKRQSFDVFSGFTSS